MEPSHRGDLPRSTQRNGTEQQEKLSSCCVISRCANKRPLPLSPEEQHRRHREAFPKVSTAKDRSLFFLETFHLGVDVTPSPTRPGHRSVRPSGDFCAECQARSTNIGSDRGCVSSCFAFRQSSPTFPSVRGAPPCVDLGLGQGLSSWLGPGSWVVVCRDHDNSCASLHLWNFSGGEERQGGPMRPCRERPRRTRASNC